MGVGNYLAGSATNLTQATDPHDVILLEAAEGGYIFAASFILLVVGSRIRALALAAHRARGGGCGGTPRDRRAWHGRRVLGARNACARVAARRDGVWACRAAQGGRAGIGHTGMSERPVHAVVVAYHAPAQLTAALPACGASCR